MLYSHCSLYGQYVVSVVVPLFSLLIILSNDVHPNPGPTSVPSTDTSSSEGYQEILNSGLSIMHLNIQSLKPKTNILEVEAQPYDILVFTETWLCPNTNDEEIIIPNFSAPVRCDRVGRIGGGVAIYVRDGITFKPRRDLGINGLEALWIELQINKRKILLGGFYRPPSSNANYWNLIEQSIDQAFNESNDNIVITGDFNIDVNVPNNKIENLISSYSAAQLIETPTNFTEHSQSLIDLIIVKATTHVLTSFVADPFIPDLTRFHCPVVLVLKFNKPKSSTFKRHIWLYDRGNYVAYNEQLNQTDWETLIDNNNVEEVAQNITNTILTCAKNTIPNKLVTIRPNDIPWLNNNIRKLMRKRNKLHKKAKIVNNEQSWKRFREIRNEVTKQLREAKTNYENNLIVKLNSNTTNVKTWFKLAKQLSNKKQSQTIPTLSHNGKESSIDKEKAQILNDYFCSQSSLQNDNKTPPDLPTVNVSLDVFEISPNNVIDAIRSMDSSKACGPDMVSPRLLKEGVESLAQPLSRFFNNLLQRSLYPSDWKLANVTPIFKKSDPSNPANYRPISLLSCIGKVMERCIHKHLYNYLVSNNLLTSFQSGFIRGDSTTNQLVYIYNDICSAIDQGKEVRTVFCDISKAFDRVWHQGLLVKLASLGVKENLISWFRSYLSMRKQRVVYLNTFSEWQPVSAGVPQGSILGQGPLLFLVYINDIVNSIRSSIRLFADDTSLYIVVDSPNLAAQQLNSDLEKINLWSQTWLVSFNPSKTETITFSRKQNKPSHPPIYLNNCEISTVKTHKHLGLSLSEDARWANHISQSLQKAWQRIGILRSLKFKLNRNCLEKMYNSFVRPLLEYSDVVWDNCSNQLKSELESVQNEAARIVTGATKLCNINSLLSDLGWEPLSVRRKKHRLILMYKIKNNQCPNYLTQLLPTQRQERYQLRNSANIPLIPARTQLYQHSFYPETIRDWNALSNEIRESSSLTCFKQALNRNIRKPPQYYNIGCRKGQILHSRLRLGCSSLNHDLYRKSIIDSPLCSCGSVETIKHFLLECPLYNALRTELLASIPCLPTTNNLLYGHDRLTTDENILIFLSVQKYILATKRF